MAKWGVKCERQAEGVKKNKWVYPFKGNFSGNHVVILWRENRERWRRCGKLLDSRLLMR